jgi:hypothetical protein
MIPQALPIKVRIHNTVRKVGRGGFAGWVDEAGDCIFSIIGCFG